MTVREAAGKISDAINSGCPGSFPHKPVGCAAHRYKTGEILEGGFADRIWDDPVTVAL